MLLYRLGGEYHIDLIDVGRRHVGHSHLICEHGRVLRLRFHRLCVVALISHF